MALPAKCLRYQFRAQEDVSVNLTWEGLCGTWSRWEMAQRNSVYLLPRVANSGQKTTWKREDISDPLLPCIITVRCMFCNVWNFFKEVLSLISSWPYS